MKKFLLTALFIGLFCVPSQAEPVAFTQPLRISGTQVIDYVLTSGVTVTTDSIEVDKSGGYASLFVIEDKSGGAGDVDIYAEYAYTTTSDALWSRPYISNMSGTTTVEGDIIEALGNTTEWIVFTVRMAPYIRFIIAPDANSELTAIFTYQRDK